ncbi:MAG TPA: hypothetical protein VFS83_05070 [Ktedonobacterales bacterium]|nr:hypothetical protein [Ktedonobacterales bacterium]
MTAMRGVLKALYWFIAGGLVGVGCIAILSIGVCLIAVSVPLVVLGAVRGWLRELWAGLVGFGLAPMVILLADLQGRDQIQPTSTADFYQFLAIGFGVIAAFGVALGIAVETFVVARQAHQARQ